MNTTTTIDMTPTWGEWGNVYRRFAEGDAGIAALRPLANDFAKAMAACQALSSIDLTDEQQAIVNRVMRAELVKQGFGQPLPQPKEK
jgi:hypothetical protein